MGHTDQPSNVQVDVARIASYVAAGSASSAAASTDVRSVHHRSAG